MATISAALGAASAPLTIENDGKTYTIGHITGAVKSKMERWLQDLVIGAEVRVCGAMKAAGLLTDAFARERMDVAVKACLSPDYAFGGVKFAELIGGDSDLAPAKVHLIALLCGCTDEEVIDLAIAKGDEFRAKVSLVFREGEPAEAGGEGKGEGSAAAAGASDPKAPAA